MELKAFTSLSSPVLVIHTLLCTSIQSFDLNKVNLANSKITSIEHITMNPSDELYDEYYSDYDFTSDSYDHIGDIEDLVSVSYKKTIQIKYVEVHVIMKQFLQHISTFQNLIFPTLGRDELNLSIGPMALSVAEVGDFTKDYGTYIGDIRSHSHGIRGHVYIVDQNHLYIRKFSYDGGGSLDAYFWVNI